MNAIPTSVSGTPEPAPSSPIVVLLVDDQPIVAKLLERILESEPDIRFHYCRDPREAAQRVERTSPTLILQDLVMPEADGLEMVRRFRAAPATREIPIIMLSTKEDPQIKSQAFALGANDYLVKLPDKLEMIARIRYHSKAYLCRRQSEKLTHQMAAAVQAKSALLAQLGPLILSASHQLNSAAESLAETELGEAQLNHLKAIRSSSKDLVKSINRVFEFLQT